MNSAKLDELAHGFQYAEGPVWLQDQQKLIFSDISMGFLFEWSEAHGLKVVRKAPGANGNAVDDAGRIVTCHHDSRNVVRTEHDGNLTVLCSRFRWQSRNGVTHDFRLNSPNDLVIHSGGSVWFTDPVWGLMSGPFGAAELGSNNVFRLDPRTGDLIPAVTHLCMPNGIAFSPDERRLYVCDMCGPPGLVAFALKPGGVLRQVWRAELLCDGICVDEAGTIFAGTAGGSDYGSGIKVVQDDIDIGVVIGSIEFPADAGNCCFGGVDGKTLFVTTRKSVYSIRLVYNRTVDPRARHHLSKREQILPTITSSVRYHVAYLQSMAMTQ